MVKLALVVIAVLVCVQFAMADTRQKRQEETTTPNLLENIKTGIENTFSEQNIKAAVNNLNDFGDKLKTLGTKVVNNFQNAMKKDEVPPATAA